MILGPSHMLMGGGAGGITLPQNVFATTLYTGTGSAQTITNGIDLLGSGGLTWIKSRSSAFSHTFYDTARASNYLASDTTAAEAAGNITFSNSGFSSVFGSGATFASWSFRKAPKFFDCITYTGDGTSGRQIPHTLGVAPGMIVVKGRTNSVDWSVWHAGSGNARLYLNQTIAATTDNGGFWGNGSTYTAPTSTTFTVSNAAGVNAAGVTYVAYLWAHDPDTTNGIVQCGSFTTDASGNASVSLGWSPQFILAKTASTVGGWVMLDTARGWDQTANDALLTANTSNAEGTGTDRGTPTASGFTYANGGASTTYVFMAIRAPIFTGPTRPQDAFATSLYTGTNNPQTVTNGLDTAGQGGLVWEKIRSSAASHRLTDTVRGGTKYLSTDSTAAEGAVGVVQFGSNGFTSTGWNAGATVASWSFVNKPRVFQCLTYTGDGTSGRQIAHALGAAPGMIIIKRRDAASANGWTVAHRSLSAQTQYLLLNSTAASTVGTNSLQAYDASTFTVGSAPDNNANGGTYIAYLWAHDPSPDGIVQAGGFTTNASLNASVSLGWGPQYLLIKSTNLSGDWILLDTARLIGNRLRANTSAAEDALGAIALTGTGFTVTGLGQGSDTYVYLAIRAPTT